MKKNKMKKNKIVSTLILFFLVNICNAQDPATGGIVLLPSTIAVNQNAIIEMDVLNGSSSAFNCNNQVIWTLVIPPNLIIDSSSAPIFTFDDPTWSSIVDVIATPWDAVDGTVVLIQSKTGISPCNFVAFPGGSDPGGAMIFDLKVKGKVIGPSVLSVGASSSPAVGTNDNSNDDATSPFTVTIALAIKLSDFAGAIHDCAASLSWKSTNEENFDRFEIEFSADGRTYQNIGTVKGQNTGASGSYKFNYPQQTIKGFYRLKMVDKNGNINYSKVVKLTNTCKEVKAFVYPNPVAAMQDANVVLQNFGKKVEGILYDAAGKQLRVVKLANGSNKLNLQQYTGGNYLLNIKDENNTAVSVRITVAR